MSPRRRSALLLASVAVLFLAGYLLQKLEDGPAAPDVPDAELTPASSRTPTGFGTPLDPPIVNGTQSANVGSAIQTLEAKTAAATTTSSQRRDLSLDEAQGGHTLSRHVGKIEQELAARLKAEPDISAASSYFDRATAERSVATVLVKKAAEIEKWERKTGSRANLALRLDLGETVGRSLKRGQSKAIDVDSVVVVLRWDGDGWYVLTSYPEDR